MKLRYDLIPVLCLRELAKCYTIGAEKYGDGYNWQTRYTTSEVVAKLMRHLEAWRGGESRAEDGQHHLAAVAFHAFALLWLVTYRPEQHDLPGR